MVEVRASSSTLLMETHIRRAVTTQFYASRGSRRSGAREGSRSRFQVFTEIVRATPTPPSRSSSSDFSARRSNSLCARARRHVARASGSRWRTRWRVAWRTRSSTRRRGDGSTLRRAPPWTSGRRRSSSTLFQCVSLLWHLQKKIQGAPADARWATRRRGSDLSGALAGAHVRVRLPLRHARVSSAASPASSIASVGGASDGEEARFGGARSRERFAANPPLAGRGAAAAANIGRALRRRRRPADLRAPECADPREGDADRRASSPEVRRQHSLGGSAGGGGGGESDELVPAAEEPVAARGEQGPEEVQLLNGLRRAARGAGRARDLLGERDAESARPVVCGRARAPRRGRRAAARSRCAAAQGGREDHPQHSSAAPAGSRRRRRRRAASGCRILALMRLQGTGHSLSHRRVASAARTRAHPRPRSSARLRCPTPTPSASSRPARGRTLRAARRAAEGAPTGANAPSQPARSSTRPSCSRRRRRSSAPADGTRRCRLSRQLGCRVGRDPSDFQTSTAREHRFPVSTC